MKSNGTAGGRRPGAGSRTVITLKLDLQSWPTTELRRTAAGWERILH